MAVSRLLKSCAMPPGQHAQALDAPGLLQFLGGAVAVGDVVEHEHRARHARPSGSTMGAALSATTRSGRPAALRCAGSCGAARMPVASTARTGLSACRRSLRPGAAVELLHGQAGGLGAVQAAERFGGGVEVGDVPLRVGRDHAVGDRIERHAQELLFVRERLLGHLERVDVGDEARACAAAGRRARRSRCRWTAPSGRCRPCGGGARCG